MIQIPASLMMSPPNAYGDKNIGFYLRESKDVLPGIIVILKELYILHMDVR